MTPTPTAPASSGVRRRWLYAILITSFLFVLMPFLFWQQTWFGRPLTDAQIEKNLADREHPRKGQHALSQIADRILSRDPATRASARRWYPQVAAESQSSVAELRLTAAWVMGLDTSAPEFHPALLRLLADVHPMVRRNAALSLVRFQDAAGRRDASGRAEIHSMLLPYSIPAPRAGLLNQRLKVSDVVNPGTMVARLESGGQKTEVRSEVPGSIERWLVGDGAEVGSGQPIVALAPSPEMVWEALRALYLIGQPEDLPAIDRYARGIEGMPESVRQQAVLTARQIRDRASSAPPVAP